MKTKVARVLLGGVVRYLGYLRFQKTLHFTCLIATIHCFLTTGSVGNLNPPVLVQPNATQYFGMMLQDRYKVGTNAPKPSSLPCLFTTCLPQEAVAPPGKVLAPLSRQEQLIDLESAVVLAEWL